MVLWIYRRYATIASRSPLGPAGLLPWLMLRLALAFGWPGLCMAQPPAPYRPALPGYTFSFPRDHGSHPEFRTEWWYYTGNLRTAAVREFGFELTFFRQRFLPPGDPYAAQAPLVADQVYLAHFAISDVQNRRHQCWERVGRGGFDQGSASTTTLAVRMQDWHALLISNADSSETMRIAAQAPGGAALDLTLTPQKPRVIHGKNGVHQKADDPGQASHYISFTRLETSGTLHLAGETFAVTGQSWMDHEFGSDQMGGETVGWDWFALQLDTGDDLMLYQLRRKDGSYNPHSAGTHVPPDGAAIPLPTNAYQIRNRSTWVSPVTGGRYPMGWMILLPAQQAELTIEPKFESQEMLTQRSAGTTYWEGAVRISGTWRGRPVRGAGYVELVGYSGRLIGL